jgi:hypothetical protein
MVSGVRGADMALRLKYDEVATDHPIEPNLTDAVRKFYRLSGRPKRIFATYTAMLDLRRKLRGRSIL